MFSITSRFTDGPEELFPSLSTGQVTGCVINLIITSPLTGEG